MFKKKNILVLPSFIMRVNGTIFIFLKSTQVRVDAIQTNRARQQTQAPATFLFKNSHFRHLICDQRFVLLYRQCYFCHFTYKWIQL